MSYLFAIVLPDEPEAIIPREKPENIPLHLQFLKQQIKEIREDYAKTDRMIKSLSIDNDLRIKELDYLTNLEKYWEGHSKK